VSHASCTDYCLFSSSVLEAVQWHSFMSAWSSTADPFSRAITRRSGAFLIK